MKNKYTKIEALSFVEKLKKMNGLEDILPDFDFAKSIKFFADKNDEDNFKIIIDRYFKLVDSYKNEKMKADSYPFLEFICSGMDNGFSRTWYSSRTGKKAKEGNAVKLLKKFYSPEEKE